MDSVINRLRNTVTTVTSTVSQLSVVLPGNPVTREFEVNQHVASGGPGMLWKIFSGFKKSTKQEASIFLFEKKLIEKWPRKDRDLMIEILKKGVQQLTKLRHPRVLTVQHPLEESRDSLAFATEPVFASLANLLGCRVNMAEPPVRKHTLNETEIKYGLLQISEALTFLHRDARMVHGNICIESIMINEQGIWKIFGLDFSIVAVGNGNEANWPSAEYEPDRNPASQRNLDYAAPEFAESPSTLTPASDMFSLALVMYAAYNSGKSLTAYHNNWNTYRQGMSSYKTLREITLHEIPPDCRPFVKRLLSFNPENRPDSIEFSKVDVLQDHVIRTLTYMDSLAQVDNFQKSKFYKSLIEILPVIPPRIRVYRIVPNLAQEFVNPTMVPFVLPNIFRIAETASKEEFVEQILPHLKDVMKLREPVQILFIFMKNMELLLQKTPSDITKSDVLPLIYGALESESIQVQEQCLSIIPSFVSLIDYPAMKNSLLPRIRKLCVSTPTLSVRVNCLVCTGKIMDHMDKWLVMDFVLPFLTEIPSRESAVIMGILGILKLATNHRKLGVTKEIIATRILPFLFPLTVESSLTLAQFNAVLAYIHELVQQLESQQRSKLEEAGAVAQPQMTRNIEAGGSANGAVMNDIFGDTISNTNGITNSSSMNLGMYDPFGNGATSTSNEAPPYTPSPAALTPRTTKPSSSSSQMGSRTSNNPVTKDLTTTLMNSQLNQMKLTNLGSSQQPQPVRPTLSPGPIMSPPYQQPASPAFPNMNSMQMHQSNSFPNMNSMQTQQPSPSFPSMNSMQIGNSASAQHPGGFPRMNSAAGNGSAFPPPPPVNQNNASQIRNIPSLVPSSLQQKPMAGSNVKLSQRDIDDFLK